MSQLMSGISGYFHGEPGLVTADRWIFTDHLWRVLELSNNPYRRCAFDYDSDIRLDPAIKPGDSIRYVHLDMYCGFWARSGEEHYPELARGLERRAALSQVFHEAWQGIEAARTALARFGIGVQMGDTEGISTSKVPVPDTTLFISCGQRDTLTARSVERYLKHDRYVKVWFDPRRPGEAPDHQDGIETWLAQAVEATRGFVVLLTAESLASQWVKLEVAAAARRAAVDPGFKVILLKMDETPVPEELTSLGTLVDSHDPLLGEEILAALHGYEGHKAWMEANRGNSHTIAAPSPEPAQEVHKTGSLGIRTRSGSQIHDAEKFTTRYYKPLDPDRTVVRIERESYWEDVAVGGDVVARSRGKSPRGKSRDDYLAQFAETDEAEAKRLLKLETIAPVLGPKGIRGWLLLPVIGLLAYFVASITRVFTYYIPTFREGGWSIITTALRPAYASMIIFEFFMNTVFIVMPAALLVLLFQKRRVLPMLMTGFYALCYLEVLVLGIVALSVAPDLYADTGLRVGSTAGAVWHTKEIVMELVIDAMLVAIMTAYFALSIRVRNTFGNLPGAKATGQSIGEGG